MQHIFEKYKVLKTFFFWSILKSSYKLQTFKTEQKSSLRVLLIRKNAHKLHCIRKWVAHKNPLCISSFGESSCSKKCQFSVKMMKLSICFILRRKWGKNIISHFFEHPTWWKNKVFRSKLPLLYKIAKKLLLDFII